MEATCKGFKVLFWNARSLYNKLDQRRIILNDYLPNVFCINETWLKEQIPDGMISIPDYSFVRLDRLVKNPHGYTKRGGWVIMFILNGLDYKVMEQPLFTVSDLDLECTTVRINRKCTKPMYIVNLYRPPNWNLERFYKMTSELFAGIDNLDKVTLIIGGDFNIDFGKPNSKGAIIMKKLAKRFSLEKQVNKSTCPLYGAAPTRRL